MLEALANLLLSAWKRLDAQQRECSAANGRGWVASRERPGAFRVRADTLQKACGVEKVQVVLSPCLVSVARANERGARLFLCAAVLRIHSGVFCGSKMQRQRRRAPTEASHPCSSMRDGSTVRRCHLSSFSLRSSRWPAAHDGLTFGMIPMEMPQAKLFPVIGYAMNDGRCSRVPAAKIRKVQV